MKSVAKFVFIVLAVITPWIGNAQRFVNEPVEKRATITYLGSKDENSIILVEVKNLKAEKLTVQVLQKNGEVLYRENFSNEKLSKRFFIPRDIVSDIKIVVGNENEKNKEEYQLNTRLVEEVYVSNK